MKNLASVRNEEKVMGRKERCPQCGSKKITITGNLKKCNVCKYEWAGKPSRRTLKKEKVRF